MSSNELSLVNSELPAYMDKEDARLGLEELGKFTRPPRLKIVQPLSKAPLIDLFEPGDVCIVPQNVPIAVHTGETKKDMKPPEFFFTPILFFPEWVTFNPRDVANLPIIRDRSIDEKSPLAVKCRDSRKWEEQCPESPDPKHKIRHTEVLNFIYVIHGVDHLAGMPILHGFMRAEHKTGSNFASLLKMQRAPIFSRVWRATTSRRDNGKGQWYGLDITAPDGNAWVSEQIYPVLKDLHVEAKELLATQSIEVNYEDDPDNVVEGEFTTASGENSPF